MTNVGVRDYLKAGYPSLALPSVESAVAEDRVRQALTELNLGHIDFGVWKITTGLLIGTVGDPERQRKEKDDLLESLLYVKNSKKPIAAVFHNIRSFLGNPAVVQAIIDAVMAARLVGSHVVFVGPFCDMPVELKSLVTYVDCPLPTRAEIKERYREIVEAYRKDMEGLPKDKEAYERLLLDAATAAVGLDSIGAENALALSLAASGRIDLKLIQAQKEQEVRKSDVLEFIRTDETLDEVGGFDVFKTWVSRRARAFTEEARKFHLPYPKGVLFVGPAGCLSGDTVLPFRRGNRNSGRLLTVRDAFYKFNQIPRKGFGRGNFKSGPRYLWSPDIPTETLSMMDDGFICYHQIEDIVFSGIKTTYVVETYSGRSIRVTAEHPFRTVVDAAIPAEDRMPFVPLSRLKVGDTVLLRDLRAGAGGRVLKPYRYRRRVVHSVPYHPHAWDHWISTSKTKPWLQFNYKRIHYARLVLEAGINQISVEDLISIVRSDPEKAAQLEFIPPSLVVHHKDGDELNDTPANLQVIEKEEHDVLSSQKTKFNMRFSGVVGEKITRITEWGEEETFDIVMRAPFPNYVANGFVVHNTGKSLCAKAMGAYLGLPVLRMDMGRIFRSLVGESEAAIRLCLQVAEAVAPTILWMDRHA